MKLFCPQGDLHAQKILVTAAFADTQISCTNLGKEGQKKQASASPSVLFPRITPSLQTETGIYLSGSYTICRYLARSRNDKKLYGATLEEQGEVDMWLDFCVHEIETPLLAAAAAAAGAAAAAAANQSAVANKAKADIGESVKIINNHLKLRTYMVGERITIADICLSVVLSAAAKKFGAELFKPFTEISRWKETICNQKAFKKAAPDCCCSSSSSSSSSSGSSRPGSAAASGSKGKPAAAAGKPAAAAAAAAADEEDTAAAAAAEAKPKCELDLLPPSPFDLNEWKRVYSNTKNLRGEALPWLWKNFDGKGFCFYYMKYEKLEGECTVAFLTSNQLGGFLQRVDNNFRKYSFAVINVVGKDNTFDIQGVWMFRGLGIPQMIKEHPSFEYNTWTPLDYNKPKDKKIIEDYFCNDDEVENRPIADCKVWK